MDARVSRNLIDIVGVARKAAKEHAAAIIVDINGAGDATTIQGGIDLLPATGGKVYIKTGTYPLTTTITMPDKDVSIEAAGEDATIISLGSSVIAMFTMGFDRNYSFEHFTGIGDGTAGQIMFDATMAVVCGGTISVSNVGTDFTGNFIQTIFRQNAGGTPCIRIVSCTFSVNTAAGTLYIDGPGVIFIDTSSFFAVGARTSGIGIAGSPTILASSCLFEVGAGGFVLGSQSMFSGCSITMLGDATTARIEVTGFLCSFVGCSIITAGVVSDRAFDLLAAAGQVSITGCVFFGAWGAEILRTAASNGTFTGNVGFDALETGAANNNLYGNNDGFDGSTIIGPGSRVDGVRAGTSTLVAEGIGKANLDTTAVGNVDAGEDDLITYTLPANALTKVGSGVKIKAWGTMANNADAKTLGLDFGSATILTFSLTANLAGFWEIEAIVARTGVDTQDYHSKLIESPGTAQPDIEGGTAAEDDGAAIIIKCTADAVTTNNVVQEGLLVEVLN